MMGNFRLKSLEEQIENLTLKAASWESRAKEARIEGANWHDRWRESHEALRKLREGTVSPFSFTSNPADGTLGYVCILAEYDASINEWVLHNEGQHQGWVRASLIETD